MHGVHEGVLTIRQEKGDHAAFELLCVYIFYCMYVRVDISAGLGAMRVEEARRGCHSPQNRSYRHWDLPDVGAGSSERATSALNY